nr:DUF5661 family protein [Niallia circulans]
MFYVTADRPIITGKIVLTHLNEFPDYYKKLKALEEEAKAFGIKDKAGAYIAERNSQIVKMKNRS